MRLVTLASLFSVMAVGILTAQAPPKLASVIGTVDKVDAAAQSFAIKTDRGESTTVKFDDKTQFMRLPAGETDAKKAVKIASAEVGAGDRVLARVQTENPTGLPAFSLYVTKQADLAQRQQKTSEEWQTQSVAGTVKSIESAGRLITISVRGIAGPPKDVVLEAAANVTHTRFNPDAGAYSASPLSTVQVGDQVRVLGQKNADVTLVKVDAIMSGSFRTLPVQIKSIDAAAGTITATDLATKKPITITVKAGTTMKRLDDQTALLMARRLNPAFQGGGRGPAAGGPPAGGPPAGGPPAGVRPEGFPGGGRGGRGGGAAADPSRLLEQQPSIQLSDLKAGDPIVVTGAVTGAAPGDLSKLSAMTLIAGVEPILRAAPQNGPDPLGGNWNFGDVAPPQ